MHFTPEREPQSSRIGGHGGTDTERLVKDAALRLLAQDARLRAAVREGIAQADREEFIEEEEMDVGIERMLRPACVSGQGPTLVAKNANRMGHPASWLAPPSAPEGAPICLHYGWAEAHPFQNECRSIGSTSKRVQVHRFDRLDEMNLDINLRKTGRILGRECYT